MRQIFPLLPGDASAHELSAEALDALYAPPSVNTDHGFSLRANMVTSLDGRAAAAGLSDGISSAADRAVFRVLRAYADCIVVGAGTARAERYRPPRLSEQAQQQRLDRGQSALPGIALVSASLSLGGLDELIDAPGTHVITCADSDVGRRRDLQSRATVIEAGSAAVDLGLGLGLLASATGPHLLTEGGPGLLGQLMALDLIDELCLTISPLIVGDEQVRLVQSQPSGLMQTYRPASVLMADDALITRYQRSADSGAS